MTSSSALTLKRSQNQSTAISEDAIVSNIKSCRSCRVCGEERSVLFMCIQYTILTPVPILCDTLPTGRAADWFVSCYVAKVFDEDVQKDRNADPNYKRSHQNSMSPLMCFSTSNLSSFSHSSLYSMTSKISPGMSFSSSNKVSNIWKISELLIQYTKTGADQLPLCHLFNWHTQSKIQRCSEYC